MAKKTDNKKNIASKTDSQLVRETLQLLAKGYKIDAKGAKVKVSEASQLKALALLVDILGMKSAKQIEVRHDLVFLNEVSSKPFTLPSKQRDIIALNKTND